MNILMIILAVVGGAVLSMQAAIGGKLGSNVGVFRSAFLTFSTGALVTALLIFSLSQSMHLHCWMFQNGSYWGLFVVCLISLLW